MSQSEIEKVIDKIRSMAEGTIFSTEFIKKDGSHRKMVCRLGVHKNLKGVGLKYNPKAYGLLGVWDMQKQAYRNVNIKTMINIQIRGNRIEDITELV